MVVEYSIINRLTSLNLNSIIFFCRRKSPRFSGSCLIGSDPISQSKNKMRTFLAGVVVVFVFATSEVVLAEDLKDLVLPLKDSIWYSNNQDKSKGVTQSGSYPKGDTFNWDRKPSLDPVISEEKERESLEYGAGKLSKMLVLLAELKKQGLNLLPGTAAYMHQNSFKFSHPFSANVSKQGYLFNAATAYLKDSLQLSLEYVTFDLQYQGSLVKTDEFCKEDMKKEEPTDCTAYMHYRSFDGTCNNLVYPTWGATFTPLRRLAPPFYGDGVSKFRLAKNGKELPSTRLVSSKVNLQRNAESPSISVLHMTFGQFLDHDLDFSPLHKDMDGKDIPCCPDILHNDPSMLHPECAPIAIPTNDPFYAPFNQTCMEFVRSVPDSSCFLGPREQINEKTSYVDGSAIYGIEKSQADSLREFKDGLLKFQMTKDGEELIPPNTDLTNACNREEKANVGEFCFKSGDRRVNEQPLLALVHVMWARYHNQLAKNLKALNPYWSDERLYQEARRILTAELQHVTYNEYVSLILGKKLSKKLNLLPLKGRARTDSYDSSVSAAVSSGFAGAAFRFGHSQISVRDLRPVFGNIGKYGAQHGQDRGRVMHRCPVFMNPFVIYTKGAVTQLMRGEVKPRTAKVDPFFTPQVTGLSRGRNALFTGSGGHQHATWVDHGLAPYNRFRMACNLPLVRKFKQLKSVMDKSVVKSLKKVYSHVDDIDLFIGGLAEQPVSGGLVGPTFACILADQFYRLKVGDRYWYETDDPDTQFTTGQLKEIRKSSLAKIMCSVFPELKEVQLWPLKLVSKKNPMVRCSSLQKTNLKPWKE
ncbi:peroxidase-like [Penaeus japonicus]|uniref:peroxidase-like n=1 Tax=Penaeus japonicus TaxID=27405 RepID=UPI001C70E2C9|nr:peroxidase-like [Penaeus japonicus]